MVKKSWTQRELISIEEHELAQRCGFTDARWRDLAARVGLKQLLLSEEVLFAAGRKLARKPPESAAAARPLKRTQGALLVEHMVNLAFARKNRGRVA